MSNVVIWQNVLHVHITAPQVIFVGCCTIYILTCISDSMIGLDFVRVGTRHSIINIKVGEDSLFSNLYADPEIQTTTVTIGIIKIVT